MNPSTVESLVARAEALLARLEAVLPLPLSAPDWSASIAFRYRKRGGSGRIEPVRHVAPIRLDELVEVEPQKQRLLRNTEQFVAGHGANNVLLTGARGTGKSSLIKACLNEFAPRGLRLIEVDKADLVDLPDIVDLVAERPERFIVYLRRPELRRGRARLQGAEVDPRRLGVAGARQRADLRHQQPPPSAARVHEGEPQLQAHRGRRGAPRRGGRGEDLAVANASACGSASTPSRQAEYLAIVAQWLRGFGVR